MALAKGSQALASDTGKTRGNKILYTDFSKTQGALIYYTDIKKQLKYADVTLDYKPNNSWGNNGLYSYGNGWKQGVEGTNGYILTEISSITSGSKTLTFHWEIGQANTGENASDKENRVCTATLDVGYGVSGNTSFTSAWTVSSSNCYFQDSGNYGDKTLTFSIPSGNVLKFKLTKSGYGAFREIARLTNVYIQ